MSDSNQNDENVDEYYDYLPADHPLLQRVQQQIEQQLKKEEESLRLLHKEKEEELKKVKRKREDLGVELYSYQQSYAKLEDEFTNKIERYNELRKEREDSDNILEIEKKKYKEKSETIKNQLKLENQANNELSQLNMMLKYVEDYNKQISSEIKVTTTNAQKLEKNILQNEKDKKEQDFLIDYLEEQIKTLTEKKFLYEAQLKSQQEETKDARENLSEAQEEISNLQEIKRNLIKDWDKSLISMKTRDKTLQVVRDYIKEQESEKLKYTSQIFKYSDLIQNEIYENNKLNHEIRKVNMKLSVVKEQIRESEEKRVRYDEKRTFLTQSIFNTNEEIKSLDIKSKNLQLDIDIIEKNKLKLFEEAKVLTDKNMMLIGTKETYEKQTENLAKLNDKLQKEKFDIGVEIDLKSNEVMRIDIDRLNVESQNNKLKQKREFMEKRKKELELDYIKLESKEKETLEVIEKKELTVDKLNKKFGEINSKNRGGEDLGIYEWKIKELVIEIDNLSKHKNEIEQEWITKKTSLVAKEKLKNEILEENTDKRHKKMILEHKRARLNQIYEMHEKEIREIEISLKNLDYDMNKYNGMLSKNTSTKGKIGFKYFDVEVQFKDRLKQLENETIKLEIEIEVLREEKSDTLTQILEVERQIHLWERKIKLEEQMQEIVKPDKGMKDIDQMRSILHKQNLLYKKLMQEQEDVIKNMEMAVQRRDYIKIRYPVDRYGFTTGGARIAHTAYNRELKNLHDDLKHIKNEKKALSDKILEVSNNNNVIKSRLDHIDNELANEQNHLFECNNTYLITKIDNNSLLCNTKINQDKAKILEDFSQNKFRPRRKEDVRNDIEKYQGETEQILEILRNYRDTNGEAGLFLNKLIEQFAK